jgi:uncharacterized membrane protein
VPDALLEVTALPNLHPALVHFPIALAAVALLFDALLLLKRDWRSLDASSAALWALAAAGAGAAYLAGERAADEAGLLESAAEVALGEHADAALAALIAVGLVAVFRIWLAWRHRSPVRVASGALRAFALLLALAVQGFVAYAADLGGALVYRHGVAVSGRAVHPMTPAAIASSRQEPTTASDLVHLEAGALTWMPRAGDEAALGGILESLGEAAVRVATTTANGTGLSLVASGRALLALPGSWRDVQLEVRVDNSEFEGSFALAARLEDDSTGGFLRIHSDGGTQLVARRERKEELLDQMQTPVSTGEKTLGLSAVGRHWKGFADGETLVHGHVELPGAGRTALLLDGTGTIRLISVRIAPVNAGKAPGKPQEDHAREH